MPPAVGLGLYTCMWYRGCADDFALTLLASWVWGMVSVLSKPLGYIYMMCVYIYIYIYIFFFLFVYLYIHTCMYIYIYNVYISLSLSLFLHIYIYIYIYICYRERERDTGPLEAAGLLAGPAGLAVPEGCLYYYHVYDYY